LTKSAAGKPGGVLSNIDNFVHDLASKTANSMTDKELITYFSSFLAELEETIGVEYMEHLVMITYPHVYARLMQPYQDSVFPIAKYLSDTYNLKNFYKYSPYKSQTVGAYTDKSMSMIVPVDPDVSELILPEDFTIEEPVQEGRSTVTPCTMLVHGIKVHEKLGLAVGL
jgi:hypothetical protein